MWSGAIKLNLCGFGNNFDELLSFNYLRFTDTLYGTEMSKDSETVKIFQRNE